MTAAIAILLTAAPAGFYAGATFAKKNQIGTNPPPDWMVGIACAALPPMAAVLSLLLIMKGHDTHE